MSLDHAILGLLAERPRSGYDLKTRCFDGPLARFWSADQAQIYRTLNRLRDEKLVRSTRRRQSGRPDRHVYEITVSGHEALDVWLATPSAMSSPREPFLLQLYMGAELPDESLLAIMRAQRDQHQARLDQLRDGAAQLAAEESLSDRDRTLRQTAFEGAVVHERAVLDWLDDCIDAVQDGALPGSSGQGIGQRHLFGT